MALTGDQQKSNRKYIQLGNRNDYCYVEAMELIAKDEREYSQKFAELKGRHEGKPMFKIRKGASEVCISLDKLHQIVKENPLPEDK